MEELSNGLNLNGECKSSPEESLAPDSPTTPNSLSASSSSSAFAEKILNVVIIGLGKQGSQVFLPAVLKNPSLRLVGVCDRVVTLSSAISEAYDVPGFDDVEEMLKILDPDFAICATQHNAYLGIIKTLVSFGVHIFKEKPLASSMTEAIEIERCIRGSPTRIMMGVAIERRYDILYQTFREYINEIGSIHLIEARYTLSVNEINGWRNNYNIAGGGALLDMGYHFVDLLIWYFGHLTIIKALMSGLGLREVNQNLETTSLILFTVGKDFKNQKIQLNTLYKPIGSLTVSSVSNKKEEKIVAVGSKGSAILQDSTIHLYNNQGVQIQSFSRDKNSCNRIDLQIDEFTQCIRGEIDDCATNYIHQMEHVAFVSKAYESYRN